MDSTLIPPTAQEVAGAIANTGKPVGMAILSHEHWSAADVYQGVQFATLPAIREAVIAEASAGEGSATANIAHGPDLDIGMAEMSGVPVEFRHYENAEAPHHVVVVLPDQKSRNRAGPRLQRRVLCPRCGPRELDHHSGRAS